MTLSRSAARQREKENRKRKNRRYMSLTLVAAGIVLVFTGVALTAANGGKLSSLFGLDQDSAPKTVTDGSKSNDGNNGGSYGFTLDDNHEDSGNAASNQGTDEAVSSDNGDNEENAAANQGGDAAGISLSFVGDVLPGEYLNALMEQNGFGYPYEKAFFYLSEPDITAGNLELPITLGGTPIEGTQYVYKGSPDALPALKKAGFDVLSLATNHAMDQGVEGMRDTIAYLDEAGLGHMGTGNNDTEAFKPYVMEAKGIKVAFIGVSKVIPYKELKADSNVPGIAETYETTRAVKAIQAAEEEADITVVMVHWGEDNKDMPVDYQKQYARAYIDAGADLVIGSHPHVLQGFERYNGKWIAYSLGNFIFSSYPKGANAETGVLDARCSKDGECELAFNPMIVVQGQPNPLEGEASEAMLARLSSLSFGAKLDENGKITAE
ncbi:CapA family protein [Paenibacillus sp. HB172176]|uniref:CapA family protein n=1 Tax=Paenibacillus sp. HB172176 TaxID=2493690 RepID=UPI00143B20AA|nr:CapA family protein [Paenibacillus sp. HB172176]